MLHTYGNVIWELQNFFLVRILLVRDLGITNGNYKDLPEQKLPVLRRCGGVCRWFWCVEIQCTWFESDRSSVCRDMNRNRFFWELQKHGHLYGKNMSRDFFCNSQNVVSSFQSGFCNSRI